MKEVKILFPYLKKYKGQFIVSFLCMIMIAIISILPAKIVQNIFDIGFINKKFNYILKYSFVLGFFLLIKTIFTWGVQILYAKISNDIVADARNLVYKKIMELPLPFFTNKDSGYVTSRMNEVDSISQVFSPSNFQFITSVIEATIAAIWLFRLNKELLFFSCIPVLFVFFIARIAIKSYYKSTVVLMEKGAEYSGKINESIKGQEEIRIHSEQDRENEKLKNYNENLKKHRLKQNVILTTSLQTLSFISTFMSVYVYTIGGFYISKSFITIGSFMAFSQYVNKILNPFISSSTLMITLQPALASLRRINDLFFTKSSEENRKIEKVIIEEIKSVTFQNVHYSYNSSNKIILNNLSFCIRKPNLIIIKGKNGSGKTTLVKLLLKLYNDYQGEIFFNDINSKTIVTKSIRQNCATVSQKVFLFNDTIYHNLVYGIENIDKKRFNQVLAMTKLDVLIEALPEKEDTFVGEEGVKLSGGEKQKISIARALLKNPDMYIFDEPISNVDQEMRQLLKEIISTLSTNKIIFLIDHTDYFDNISKNITIIKL